MRNLIKKILKEEVNWAEYPVEVGDIYTVSSINDFFVRNKGIRCYPKGKGDFIGTRSFRDLEGKIYEVIHDGCYIDIERSDDGKKWKDAGSVERNWIRYLIHVRYWRPFTSFRDTENIFNTINEELDTTSWETEEGKVTLTDLLDVTKDIPIKNIPLEKLKPILLRWGDSEKELIRVDQVSLNYPILVFVKGDKLLKIIDGNHRVHKAIKQGEKEIKGKLIQIDKLPEGIRKVFKHIDTSSQLKEQEDEFRDVRIGDIYSKSEEPTKLIRIESINCYDEPHSKETTIPTQRWGSVKIQHDGCYIQYKVSNNNGKNWHWPDGDDEYKIEKNWINFIIKKGFWNLMLEGDIDFFLNESEDDFDWVDIPEVPKMYSYMDKVRYALLNTEFELKYDGSNGSWQIWLNNPNGEEGYSGSMVSQRTPYFKPDIILPDVKDTVDNHRHEWYHPFYEKLYNILIQIPENTLKESEDEFDWINTDSKSLFDDDRPIAIWVEDLSPRELDRVIGFFSDYNKEYQKWWMDGMLNRKDWPSIKRKASILIFNPTSGLVVWTHQRGETQKELWRDIELQNPNIRKIKAEDILKIY